MAASLISPSDSIFGNINFNPDYILEALRQCDLEQVRLDMSDDSMPAKFTLGESFTYVVMPISGA